MTEIVIQHSGSIPNVDAMEACIEFAHQNYRQRLGVGYGPARSITTRRGFNLEVVEEDHPNKEDSACSVIFKVKEQGGG